MYILESYIKNSITAWICKVELSMFALAFKRIGSPAVTWCNFDVMCPLFTVSLRRGKTIATFCLFPERRNISRKSGYS